MFKSLFTPRRTTKSDVVLAIGAALAAAWKAVDTYNTFKEENKEIEE